MLADRIAPYASPIFSIAAQGGSPTFFEAWGAALAYSLQLYFDFSGYSDMAIGAARMFGIKLPLNFNSPYKAVNIIDFWRRWHITLSRFLKDYLYIPLGGNRHGKGRRYFNLMVTMLLGGLWHGAGWNFIFWGGLHGVYLTLNHQWHSVQKALGKNPNMNSWLSLILSRLITFLAVVFAWVFFRSENMNTAFAMLSGMIGLNGIVVPTLVVSIFPPLKSLLPLLGITVKPIGGVNFISTYFWVFMLLAIAWFTPNTQQWMQLYKPALDYHPEKHSFQWGSYFGKNLFHWKPTLKFGLVIGIIIFLSVKSVVTAAPSEFLYFNF